MRYRIRWHTEYRYDAPVTDQHNTVRVKPAATPTQRVDDFRLAVEPSARLHSHIDYFGTEVIDFNVHGEHDRLEIDATALVSTDAPPLPRETRWEALEGPTYRDAAGEFILSTGDEPSNGAIHSLCDAVRRGSPLATLRSVCETIPDRFEYKQGVTYVDSTVDDLLETGAGVCQDFVHLSLILLRTQGIGARYVSGYLFAAGGEGDDSAEVDMHAWVEALLPDGNGGFAWTAADPTNRALADEQYVKVGHGRFYGDVAPIRGIFRGTAQAQMDAGVVMTRVAG